MSAVSWLRLWLNAQLNCWIDLRPWHHPLAHIKTTQSRRWAETWFWRTPGRHLPRPPLITRRLWRVMDRGVGDDRISRAKLGPAILFPTTERAGEPAFTCASAAPVTQGARRCASINSINTLIKCFDGDVILSAVISLMAPQSAEMMLRPA